MKFDKKYIKFKGMELHVTGTYTQWDYDNDSSIIFTQIGKQVNYSMGVGHFDDYSKVFLECPELINQLTECVLPILDKQGEQ